MRKYAENYKKLWKFVYLHVSKYWSALKYFQQWFVAYYLTFTINNTWSIKLYSRNVFNLVYYLCWITNNSSTTHFWSRQWNKWGKILKEGFVFNENLSFDHFLIFLCQSCRRKIKKQNMYKYLRPSTINCQISYKICWPVAK